MRDDPLQLATLGEDAPVVRGGSRRDRLSLLEELRDQEAAGEPVRLSVFIVALGEGSPSDAILRACQEAGLPHGMVQVSTVGRLLGQGFIIADERADDEASCHYHVHFPTPVEEWMVDAWFQAFDEPVRNPAKGGGAR